MRRAFDQPSLGQQSRLSTRQEQPIFVSVARRTPVTARVGALAALVAGTGLAGLLLGRPAAGVALLAAAATVAASAFARRRC